MIDKTLLSDRELLIFNQEVSDRNKNTAVAYLLWWFTGFMGGHRYYFGKTSSAIAMTLIFWLGVWLLGLGAIITGIWALVDVFMINGWLNENRRQVEQEVYDELMRNRNRANMTAQNGYAQPQAQPAQPQMRPQAQPQQPASVQPQYAQRLKRQKLTIAAILKKNN